MNLTNDGTNLRFEPVTLIAFIVGVIVQIAFAIGVSADAKHLAKDRPMWLVGRFMWFFATLFGGVPVAAAYWLMHRSTLNPPRTGVGGTDFS